MKAKTLLSSLLLFTCIITAFGQPKVTVYTNDFNGMSAELAIGKYDHMTLLRSGVMMVRSVKIPAGMQVTLFEKDNFEGMSLVLLQNADMKLIQGKGFGQVIQNVSLIIEKAPESVLNEPTITIYKDNFSGPSMNLRAGYYDHYELGAVENDKVSSLKVPKGMKATIYEHGGYKGRSLVITQDATADYLIRNNFNDITSSIYVEVIPEPAKDVPVVKEEPLTEPKEELPVVVVDENDLANPMTTIFEGNYAGASKKLGAGRYTAATMGISDNALSSIKVPEGLIVTLYDQANFKGKSFILKGQDAQTANLGDFNNVVSSMVVELIPRAILYQDNFSGAAAGLEPGNYNVNDLGIGNDELSSVKLLKGVWVLLFEHSNFKGRSLLLSKDASSDFIEGKDFNNLTSSIIVGSADTPLPVVTLFGGDREESLKKLTPGEYPLLDVGNNLISSVEIPRGLRVTLFENAGYEGRSMEITKSVGTDFLKKYEFDNLTSSIKIEPRDPRDLVVKIFSGRYDGFSEDLIPGKYYARDLQIGRNSLTSLKVPRGMQVELFANDDLTGAIGFADRDTDFTGFKLFDNYYSSLIVKDVHLPVVTPVAAPPPPDTVSVPPAPPKPEEQVEPAPRGVYSYDPPCEMNDDQFQNGLRAIQSKPFSDEKMETVMLVTKDKCLTNNQIREIARQFNFEEQTLEFVKYAYEKASEKETYYLLENVFKFASSKEAFMKFLKEH